MDIQLYCETMGRQLVGWKAKIYDVIRGAEKMPVEEKAQFGGSLAELNSLVDELDESLTRLAEECPIDWSARRESIDDRLAKMQGILAKLSGKVGIPDSIAWL